MLLTTYESRAVTPERLISAGAVRPTNQDGTLFFVRSIENPLHDFVVRVRGQSAECDCLDYAHYSGCQHVTAVLAFRMSKLPRVDCYSCKGSECMVVYPDGLHVCEICGRRWRKPAKMVRPEAVEPVICAKCHREVEISFEDKREHCGCA